ncbi:glycosyltransferase [Psychromonas sp. MME2]|uniref:glycosyltransferase n=1 Tax=unclassified Psychromonas TaxID=2614957 RepID=UPI00339C1253
MIYNSVNIEHFPEKIKHTREQITLGCAGRLVTQKNQIVLIEMVKQLVAAGLNIKLLIAGKGELEEKLKQLILASGMQEHIHLLGFSQDINEFLEQIDIFAFPSLYEGSANILVEVMAKGLPCVTYNRSSMPEMIIHNETGLLANNDQEFCDALKALISSADLRDKLGSQARQFARKNFNSDDIYKQIENVIGQ